MANICSFNMRIRGAKDACHKLVEEGLRSTYEAYIVNTSGSDDDCLMLVDGECRGSVTSSMVRDKEDGLSLIEQSKALSLEIEVVGYDISEPEWIEHYHFDKGETLKEYNLMPSLPECYEDFGMEVDIDKYEFNENACCYVVKPEFAEPFEWDYYEEKMIVEFAMPETL